MANATNTVALWPAGLASAFAYRKDVPGAASARRALGREPRGGVRGSLLLNTSDTAFVHLIPWLLLVATSFSRLASGYVEAGMGSASPRALVLVAIVQTDHRPLRRLLRWGDGILMLASISLTGMTDIHAMNALKTILGASSTAWPSCCSCWRRRSLGGPAG